MILPGNFALSIAFSVEVKMRYLKTVFFVFMLMKMCILFSVSRGTFLGVSLFRQETLPHGEIGFVLCLNTDLSKYVLSRIAMQ